MNTRGPRQPMLAKPRASQQCRGAWQGAESRARFWLRGVGTTYWVICRSCGFLGGFPASYPPCPVAGSMHMQHLKGAAHSLCHGFRQMQVARLKLLHRNYFLALHRDTWHLVVTDKQMKLLFTPCSLLDLKEVGFPNYEWTTTHEQLWFLKELLIANGFSSGRFRMFHILQTFCMLVAWGFRWKWNLVHACLWHLHFLYLYLLPLKQLCLLWSLRFLHS